MRSHSFLLLDTVNLDFSCCVGKLHWIDILTNYIKRVEVCEGCLSGLLRVIEFTPSYIWLAELSQV